jgi:hypothetical protein
MLKNSEKQGGKRESTTKGKVEGAESNISIDSNDTFVVPLMREPPLRKTWEYSNIT